MDMLVKNFHFLIIGWCLYSQWLTYEEHQEKVNQAMASRAPMQTKIAKLKKDVKAIESFKKNRDKVKARVENVTAQIQKMQKQLPTDDIETVMLTLLDKEAKTLNIQNVRPSPGKEINNGFYFSKDYRFSGTGTFLQFLIMFERVGKVERLINTKEVTLIADETGKKSRFQMLKMSTLMESFRYNPSYKEKSGVKEIEAKFK